MTDTHQLATQVSCTIQLYTSPLQDADKTDIYQLSRNWADLVKRARGKQLAPDEFNSGTFTISNMGMYGPDAFDAILPPGQMASTAALLGQDHQVLALEQRQVRHKQFHLLLRQAGLSKACLVLLCRHRCHSGSCRQQAHCHRRQPGQDWCRAPDED